jgi:hypothetical protein
MTIAVDPTTHVATITTTTVNGRSDSYDRDSPAYASLANYAASVFADPQNQGVTIGGVEVSSIGVNGSSVSATQGHENIDAPPAVTGGAEDPIGG